MHEADRIGLASKWRHSSFFFLSFFSVFLLRLMRWPAIHCRRDEKKNVPPPIDPWSAFVICFVLSIATKMVPTVIPRPQVRGIHQGSLHLLPTMKLRFEKSRYSKNLSICIDFVHSMYI